MAANQYPNLNANITDERPKHEQVKDEPAIAAVALTRGQSVSITAAGTGIPGCNIAAQGAIGYVVMEDVAAGALARLRHIGHAPFLTQTAIPSGSYVTPDGAGNWAVWASGAGDYYGGRLEDAASGQANHLVGGWCERGGF